MKYKRILLKLSGEALVGEKGSGIDPEILVKYSNEIKKPLPKNSSCMQINTLRNEGNFPPLD